MQPWWADVHPCMPRLFAQENILENPLFGYVFKLGPTFQTYKEGGDTLKLLYHLY